MFLLFKLNGSFVLVSSSHDPSCMSILFQVNYKQTVLSLKWQMKDEKYKFAWCVLETKRSDAENRIVTMCFFKHDLKLIYLKNFGCAAGRVRGAKTEQVCFFWIGLQLSRCLSLPSSLCTSISSCSLPYLPTPSSRPWIPRSASLAACDAFAAFSRPDKHRAHCRFHRLIDTVRTFEREVYGDGSQLAKVNKSQS